MTTVESAGTTSRKRLTQEQMEEYRREFAQKGYVLFKNVVSRDKLSRLRDRIFEELDVAKRSNALFAGGGQLSGHLNCFTGEESRFIYDEVEAYGIIDFVRLITPEAVRMPNVGGNINFPGCVAQHYHTDRPFLRHFMVVNTAIVDNTIENGATDVLPGTHQKFIPFWKFALGREFRKTTRVVMQQGDVIVRDSNLWHRGMPNNGDTPRPMAALTWEDGGSMHDDPYSLYEGKITFLPNWFRPTTLGRIREKVFVTAPLSYSAYRFVDSLLTQKGYDFPGPRN
jgi:hypothetical protein